MLEPFTAKEFVAWLQRKHGAKFIRQTGSHCYWVTKDGLNVGCPDHKSSTPHPIDTVLAARIARSLGMSLGDLRAEFGQAAAKRSDTKKRTQSHRAATSPVKVHVPLPPTADVLGRRLLVLGDRITRSGPARAQRDTALRALERHTIRVQEWLDQIEATA